MSRPTIMQTNAWFGPGRMFRFLGRLGDVVFQWRAKDADSARHIHFGNGGRVEIRAVYRDWPVHAPVEMFLPAHAKAVFIEQSVDGFATLTFDSGELVRIPFPEPPKN